MVVIRGRKYPCVSFEYDYVLTERRVEFMFNFLKLNGVVLKIVTWRNEFLPNKDLYAFCKSYGIKKGNIIFCNGLVKSSSIKFDLQIDVHVDASKFHLRHAESLEGVKGICIDFGKWEKLLLDYLDIPFINFVKFAIDNDMTLDYM